MNTDEAAKWRQLARSWRAVSPPPEPPGDLRQRILDAVEPGRSWPAVPVTGLALAASVMLVAVVGAVMSWQAEPVMEIPPVQRLAMEPLYPIAADEIQVDGDSPCSRPNECLGPGSDILPGHL